MLIQNKQLSIEISPNGAELQSIRKGKTEYLWQGDPEFWGRRSPVLFPIVGGLYQDKYRVGGQEYKLPRHGFARDAKFEEIPVSETEVLYRLNYSPETLSMYPYKFELCARYRLWDNRLNVCWTVRNVDDKTMYFQIGAHPAFLYQDYDADDEVHGYEMFEVATDEDFEEAYTLRTNILSAGGCCLNQYKDIKLEDGFLPLTEDTFSKDALVLENGQAEYVTLCDRAKRPYLRLSSIDASVMGLWSPNKPGCPFTCIEPWYGRADREGFDGDITRREYIYACLPGDKEDFSFEIEIL